jgi:hypothetical protein
VPVRTERGSALVFALLAISFMMAVGSALTLLSTSETLIASHHRLGLEAFYAADAALERALVDFNGVLDWTPVLDGSQLSTFVDGPPSGVRVLADGSALDLGQVVSQATCQKATPCTQANATAITAERPWGANNPMWQLYAYGPLADVAGAASVRSTFYVVVMVADDPAEIDGNPARDGDSVAGVPSPGVGVVVVRVEAFGPKNAHRALEATIARIDTAQPAMAAGVRLVNWREAE